MHSPRHLAAALLLALPLHASAIEVVPWTVTQRQGVVMQEEDLSCGAAAVAMVLQSLYGEQVTEADVLKAMGTQGFGANVNQMLKGIDALGFQGRALTLRFEDLAKLSIPVVLYIKPPLSRLEMGHFVVLTRVTDGGVSYRDPSYGNRVLAEADFRRYWEIRSDKNLPGIAIAVLPRTPQQREAAARHVPVPVTSASPLFPLH